MMIQREHLHQINMLFKLKSYHIRYHKANSLLKKPQQLNLLSSLVAKMLLIFIKRKFLLMKSH